MARKKQRAVVPRNEKENPQRGLVSRGDDPYPVDVKAEAVALVYETSNFSEAAKKMAERYPDRHPSRQLVTRWFKQVDSEAFAALSQERKAAFESGVIELADKARERFYDALDGMTPQQVPIPAGIAMDKGLRLLEIEKRPGVGSGHHVGPILIVTHAQRPQIIEGEAVVVEDDQPGDAPDGGVPATP